MAERLIDTDVLVDHLRGAQRLEPDGDDYYSVVTRAELFAGRGGDEEGLRRMLGPLGELPVDRAVAELGGRVRREAGLALGDALIAATALTHGLALLTRNRRHFERVAQLELSRP
ncbi:MAG: type II toxin-antitoxin system VapC family toxin [Actinomycetota bacterium]|nr:type II toxin-antitoxin system VapC family toxin [Actinomycetota bacterium]